MTIAGVKRMCFFSATALLGLVICATDLTSARKHGQRSTDFTAKHGFADSLRKSDRRQSLEKEKDAKRQTLGSHRKEEHSKFAKDSLISVKLSKGRYKGKVKEVLDAKVAFFLGMRYAEAPVGKLRFKKPPRVKNWSGTKLALEYGNTCFQWRDNTFGYGYSGTEMWNPNTKMSEDCLFLNVWTPLKRNFSDKRIPSDMPLLPVMVWIYGGGFYSGTSSLDVYHGQWLAAAHEVVVVSMNYRIAAFGLLSYGTDDAPGNAGLWDQHAALLWVQDNIRHFRGDPSKVTLFGESAGAASVSLHILSEKSKGLFQNAILQSASALSPWAIISKSVMRKRALNLAKVMNCTVDSNGTNVAEKEMMACMYKTDANTTVNNEIIMEDLGTARFQNAAVVDEDFLTNDVIQKLKKGSFTTDVNILGGFNGNEGNYFLVYSTDGFGIENDSPITYAQYLTGLKKGLWGYPWQPTDEEKTSVPNNNSITLDAIDFLYTDFSATLSDRKQCKQNQGTLVCSSEELTESPETLKSNHYKQILDHVAGDINFICPVIDFLNKVGRASTSTFEEKDLGSGEEPSSIRNRATGKKFLYRFLHRSSQTPWPVWMGTLHGYEIEFAFGIPFNKNLNYTEQEVELARMMMRYWANFAKSGNPNSPGSDGVGNKMELPRWPEYTNDNEALLVFNIESRESKRATTRTAVAYVEKGVKSKHCSFWNDYYPIMQKNVGNLVFGSRECTVCTPCSSTSRATILSSASHVFACWCVLILYFAYLPDFF